MASLVATGALALGLAGCGSATSDSGQSPTATSTGSVNPSGGVTVGTPSPTVPTGGPTVYPAPVDPQVVTGTVTVTSDFGRCVTMMIDGRQHVLTGRGVSDLRSGQRVSVAGSPRTDMASYCQLGPIFQVTKVYPKPIQPSGEMPGSTTTTAG